MPIQRYDVLPARMCEEDGDYVLYTDHLTEIELNNAEWFNKYKDRGKQTAALTEKNKEIAALHTELDYNFKRIGELQAHIKELEYNIALRDMSIDTYKTENKYMKGLLAEAVEVYKKWKEITYPDSSDGDEFIEFWEDAFPIIKKIGESHDRP
jgi:hypothetical protein